MVWRELKKLDTQHGYRLRSLKPDLVQQVEALRREISVPIERGDPQQPS